MWLACQDVLFGSSFFVFDSLSYDTLQLDLPCKLGSHGEMAAWQHGLPARTWQLKLNPLKPLVMHVTLILRQSTIRWLRKGEQTGSASASASPPTA